MALEEQVEMQELKMNSEVKSTGFGDDLGDRTVENGVSRTYWASSLSSLS